VAYLNGRKQSTGKPVYGKRSISVWIIKAVSLSSSVIIFISVKRKMIKFAIVSLLTLMVVTTTAIDEPSLRGTPRELHDWQLGDFKSARPQSVPGNYYASNSTSGFRMKLYWQPGDYWHHQYNELKLCMVCHTMALGGSRCEKDDDMHLVTCTTNSTHYQFNNASSGAVQILVAGSDLCLDLSCKRQYHAITLQLCDPTNLDQYFTSGRGFFFWNLFELSANGGGCLSSTHLPKEGEYIYNQNCDQPRAVHANLWTTF
jgi:hypothetical protein